MREKLGKLFTISSSNIEYVHPIILKMCKTVEDYIACINTNIHFTKIHAAADKAINPYPLGKLFKRHANILIPEEGKTMWDLKEASQATMFQNIAEAGVISGTFKEMRQRYPCEIFVCNQDKPDVCQHYKLARFDYKEAHGIDWKYMMGQTQMHGNNQTLIGTITAYENIMNIYEEALFTKHNIKNIAHILDELKTLARANDWNGQIIFLAQHLHKFPQKALPPLYTSKKFDLETLTPETHTKVLEAMQRHRRISKRAYDLNIPEDNFDNSHVQQLMTEAFIPNPAMSTKVSDIELPNKKNINTNEVQQAISGAARRIWQNQDTKTKAYQETDRILNMGEVVD